MIFHMKEKPYNLCFETLSNDLRLKILKELAEKPRSVNDLAKSLSTEQSRLSHSLSMLRLCNYVTVRTQGKQRIYDLNPVIKQGVSMEKGKSSIFEYMDSHIALACQNHCNKLTQIQ